MKKTGVEKIIKEPENTEKVEEKPDLKDITIIAHSDCDGVLCVATILKAIKLQSDEGFNYHVFFTAPEKIFSSLAESIPPIPPGKSEFSIGDLYMCDLAVPRDTVLGSTIFDNVVWVDHHEQDPSIDSLYKELDNVTLVLDPDSKSAAELYAKFFESSSGFEDIANEIETNNVKKPNVKRLQELVGAIKMEHSKERHVMSQKLFELAQELSDDLKSMSDKKHNPIIKEYRKWLKKLDELITEKLGIYEINKKIIALFETQEWVPVYAIYNNLKEHDKAPFDLIAVLEHKAGLKKNKDSIGKAFTKIEFRTHTDLNVFNIAKSFGGTGHKHASDVTIVDGMKSDELLKKIEASGFI
ncbi:hypothetical protein KA005_71555 [bacterium]|nr:hypothetical protein [bacterium]